jgi:hypothetical protein
VRSDFPCGLFPSGIQIKTMDLSFYPTCYMSRPSRPWFDDPSKIWWRVQTVKFLIMKQSRASSYSLSFSPSIFFGILFWTIKVLLYAA